MGHGSQEPAFAARPGATLLYAMEAVVYAATGHPQDPEKRRPTLNVLRLAPDGSELRLAQTVELPEGAAMPMFQCVPPDSNTLYVSPPPPPPRGPTVKGTR